MEQHFTTFKVNSGDPEPETGVEAKWPVCPLLVMVNVWVLPWFCRSLTLLFPSRFDQVNVGRDGTTSADFTAGSGCRVNVG